MPRLKNLEAERCAGCGVWSEERLCANCERERHEDLSAVEDEGDPRERYEGVEPADFGINAGEIL